MFSIDISAFMSSPECVWKLSFPQHYAMKMVAPLVFLLLFMVWGSVAWCVQTVSARQLVTRLAMEGVKTPAELEQITLDALAARRTTRNRIVAVAAHILVIGLFVPTAVASVSPLDCTTQPSGDVTLDASPDVFCDADVSPEWISLAVLAPAMFAVYAICPLLFILYKLFGSRRELGEVTTCCGGACATQWGGTQDQIGRQQAELDDLLRNLVSQRQGMAGSEAGSILRAAIERKISVSRRKLSKLKRDAGQLFDHEVFQERYGWAFAKYSDDHPYWEIVVLLRKLFVGIVVKFLTTRPMGTYSSSRLIVSLFFLNCSVCSPSSRARFFVSCPVSLQTADRS